MVSAGVLRIVEAASKPGIHKDLVTRIEVCWQHLEAASLTTWALVKMQRPAMMHPEPLEVCGPYRSHVLSWAKLGNAFNL
jgi:hypothetical protein